jgi:hypothetical protein
VQRGFPELNGLFNRDGAVAIDVHVR